jgi:hypothetical protein
MPDIDKQSPAGAYDPSTHRMLSFHDAAAKFRGGRTIRAPISNAASNGSRRLKMP